MIRICVFYTPGEEGRREEKDIYLVVNPLVKLVYMLELQTAGQAPSNVFAIL